jgi:hypothetical protein
MRLDPLLFAVMDGMVGHATAAAVALVLVVVGCSSSAGDEIVDLTTSVAPAATASLATTTTASATTASTTTTAPSATLAPATTEARTTTSTAPSTTTVEQLATEIEEDLQAARHIFTIAMADPASLDLDDFEGLYTQDGLDGVAASAARRIAAGTAIGPGPQNLDTIVVESATLVDSDTALIIYCNTNDLVVFNRTTGAIIDDSTLSIRDSVVVYRIAGVWLRDSPTSLASYEGESCG